jgi:hypothetical protein
MEVVVLEKQKQVLGDDHPDTLLAMGNLAVTYCCLNKLPEAEELEKLVHNHEGSVDENSEASDEEASEDPHKS